MTSTCTVLWVLQMHVKGDNRHHVLADDEACRGQSLLPVTSKAMAFVRMELSTPAAPPMAEPRRLACSGQTMQRSGATWSMALLVLSSTQMISDLEWFRWRPKSPHIISYCLL